MAKRSKDTGNLIAALAAAQAEFPTISKSKVGWTTDTGADGRPQPKQYAYADIADLLNACRPILAGKGIVVMQLPRVEGTMMMLDTRLQLGEEWVEAEYPVCVVTAHPREIGAGLTYARRYALAPMIGVAAEEDMDGAGAAQIDPMGLNIKPVDDGPPSAPRRETPVEPDPPSNDEQTPAATVSREPFPDPEEVVQRAEDELGLMDTIADYDEAWAPFRAMQGTLFPMDWERLLAVGIKHRERIEAIEGANVVSRGRPGMNRGQS